MKSIINAEQAQDCSKYYAAGSNHTIRKQYYHCSSANEHNVNAEE